MLEALKFAGEIVVVTGAGGGIGQACAEVLGELGATVAAVGRTAAKFEETKRLVRAKGGACEIFAADVTDEDRVAELARWAEARGPVKAVINNAGDNFRSRIMSLKHVGSCEKRAPRWAHLSRSA